MSNILPMRSIPPSGWNGVNNAGVSHSGTQGAVSPATDTGSAGGSYVWSDSILQIGPWSSGIHTRVLKDVAVVLVAVALLVVGFIMLSAPDLNQVVKTAAKALPLVGA